MWLLALLKPLGFWGLAGLAIVDAAAIPIPQDLIIAGYVWADKRHFYLYVVFSALGSAIGGLVPFLLGRAGGEIFLLNRINRKKFENLRNRFERQEFLAIAIPSMLPPPTPWKVFVFGAGVFEMKLPFFMLAVFAGRIVRNTITAILTIEYGPRIVGVLSGLAKAHGRAMMAVLSVVIGLLVVSAMRKRRGAKTPGQAGETRRAKS